MKPRCLLSTVDRLPTISEMQESGSEDGDIDCHSHTLEAYVDSIKELSQPALYPLHGPLRGHRRWTERPGPKVTVITSSLFLNSSRTYAPWTPVDLSDVSFTLINQANCDLGPRLNENLLDRLLGQTVFAGLVWVLAGRRNRFPPELILKPALCFHTLFKLPACESTERGHVPDDTYDL